jgi:hypothetical protein
MNAIYDANSASPAPDVFQCLRERIPKVGFSQTSYDVDAQRITARRYDYKARRPDVQFRRLVDRLELDVGPGTEGAVTKVTTTAKTYIESTTQRGPTEEQTKPSTTVTEAAQTLIDQCGTPVDSTKVPG